MQDKECQDLDLLHVDEATREAKDDGKDKDRVNPSNVSQIFLLSVELHKWVVEEQDEYYRKRDGQK